MIERVIQFLAKNPHEEFTPEEIAIEIGGKRDNVRRTLVRLASTGKGSGPVERAHRGFYHYCTEKNPPILEEIARSGRVGIENMTLCKNGPGICPEGDTAPIGTTDTKGERDTNGTSGHRDIERDTNGTEKDHPAPRPGYPVTLPTGQEIQWWIYPNGTEMIIFVAGGRPAFPIETVLLILEGLKKDGLDGGWERVSLEWNIDMKRFTIAEPVTFQIAEKELLKFYQHGTVARIEDVDRRTLSFDETLPILAELYERSNGRTALKEVSKLKKDVNEMRNAVKLMQNVHRSLSDRVWTLEPKNRRARKDRPLIEGEAG